MIPLSTEEREELVCTADDDIKVKRKKPFRMIPMREVEVNGGVPLSFVVRTLNTREQMRVASMASGDSPVEPMLAAIDLGVLEVRGEGFHETDPDKVRDVMKRVPSSIVSLLGAWITEKSWGQDPLVNRK